MNAWGVVQRFNLQPRVVCHAGQAPSPKRSSAFSRAFSMNVVPVSSPRGCLERGERDQRDRRAFEDRRESPGSCLDWSWRGEPSDALAIPPLPLQGAGDAALDVHEAADPLSASSIRLSSAWRSNGRPSAVPCTSTNRPSPVLTTFMSTSARESSS